VNCTRAWPIYSTSFFGNHFSALASFSNRKVGYPVRLLFSGSGAANSLIRPQPTCSWRPIVCPGA
jgi:hypothetical protein